MTQDTGSSFASHAFPSCGTFACALALCLFFVTLSFWPRVKHSSEGFSQSTKAVFGRCLLPGKAWGHPVVSYSVSSSLPAVKSVSRDTLLQCGPGWNPMPFLTHVRCSISHFVLINFLTECEWLLAFLLCCIIPGSVPVSLIYLSTHL